MFACVHVCAPASHTGGHANMGGTGPSSGQAREPSRPPCGTSHRERRVKMMPATDRWIGEGGKKPRTVTQEWKRRGGCRCARVKVGEWRNKRQNRAKGEREIDLLFAAHSFCLHRCPRPVHGASWKQSTEAERTGTAAGAESLVRHTPLEPLAVSSVSTSCAVNDPRLLFLTIVSVSSASFSVLFLLPFILRH